MFYLAPQLVRFPFLLALTYILFYYHTGTTMPSNHSPSDSGGLSAGAIAAIAVAVFIVFILIAILIITFYLIRIGEITIFNKTRYLNIILSGRMLLWESLSYIQVTPVRNDVLGNITACGKVCFYSLDIIIKVELNLQRT